MADTVTPEEFNAVTSCHVRCGHCSEEASHRCNGCQIAYYCDATCQRAARSQHKVFCNLIRANKSSDEKVLETEARGGDVAAMWKLSMGLRMGKWRPFISAAESASLFWLRSAAEAGEPHAQFACGVNAMESSEAIAFSYWIQAAHKGHARAQFNVGRALWYGNGVEQCKDAAIAWFQCADALGHSAAHKMLAQLRT